MVERVRLLRKFLQREAVPLLVDLAIDFEEGTKAPCVVISHELVHQPFYEQLEGHTLGHIAQEDQALTLAHHRNVFFLDQGCLRKVSGEGAINIEQVLAFTIFVTREGELAQPPILIDAKFLRGGIKQVGGGVYYSIHRAGFAWHCPIKSQDESEYLRTTFINYE